MALPKSYVPTLIDGVEVYIAVQQLPGLQPMSSSATESVSKKAAESLDQVQEVIRAVAARFSGTVGHLARQAVRPESVSVEFGISVGVEGKLLLFNGSAEGSLSVTLTYPISDSARA